MSRTLFTGTAMASLMAFAAAAQAQDAATPTEAEITPPRVMENALPSAGSDEPASPVEPQTADTAPVEPQTSDTSATSPPEAVAPDTPTTADPAPAGTLPEGWVPVDLATVSAESLIGAHIRTYDGDTIAGVEDVLMAAEGKVDNLVARFGGFLGFGETQVLLAPGEVSAATDADGAVAVFTGLTPEELEGRPEYVASAGADAG